VTTCSACGQGNQPEGAKFCSECGAGLTADGCATCGATLLPSAKFCSECGTPRGSAVPRAVASRRVTSVLFGDLVGFTTLSEARDQEDVRELLSRYFEKCRQVIARYGGTVEKFIGDAVMAVWGVPTVHEDDAERAVRAGLELVNAVAALGSDIGVPELAMRVGIVTGEVAVTVGALNEGMVAGDAVNTAARVQTAAAPGQVWVDETTRLLTSSAITYIDVGSHMLKGKAEPMPLWAVRAVVAAVGGLQRADGLEAPHTGRDHELRVVKELFHRVQDTGRPALLIVDGEAGCGKSRLAWEFEKYVDGLSDRVRWHSGRCLAYGEGVAFNALSEAVRGRLMTISGQDVEEVDSQAVLDERLRQYVPDADEHAWLSPRLGVLLGFQAVGSFQRDDLFVAWTTFLHRVSEDSIPIVLVVEDAQHADDGLLSFLEHVMAVGSFPCFIALLARPSLVQTHASLMANRRTSVVHLDVLSDEEMALLVDGLVSGLPGQVRASLVSRAEGIPLFAVETVRSLIDRDLVVPRGGEYVLVDPEALDLDAIAAPASLQALIAARLDSLTEPQRLVIDAGCVLGMSFEREHLAQLCPEITNLDDVLTGLVRVQMLRQQSSRFSAEIGQFQFVQSAVQQTAYGMLSRRERKSRHLSVAHILEGVDHGTGELSPIIAAHLLDAIDAVPGDPDVAELTESMLVQLEQAADRAGALGAPAEAAAHLLVALERCPDPQRGPDIELELAEYLRQAGRYDEAVERAERVRDVFDERGDGAKAGLATATLADALVWGKGEYQRASGLAAERYELLKATDQAPEVVLRLAAALVRARLLMGADFFSEATEALRLAERVGSSADEAGGYLALGLHFSSTGPRKLAQLLLGAAADLAERVHASRIQVRALLNLNAVMNQDDAERAEEYGRRALEVAQPVGVLDLTSSAVANLLLAHLLTGAWDDALELLGRDLLGTVNVETGMVVGGEIHLARGLTWTGLDATAAEDDIYGRAMSLVMAARRATAQGDHSVAGMAVEGVRVRHQLTQVYDDFSLCLALAARVAQSCRDADAIRALLELVDSDPMASLPIGARAVAEQLRASEAILADAETAQVEEHLHRSVGLFRQWKAMPFLGLALADRGLWLVRQGRVTDGDEALGEARSIFERLGATVWLEDLDAELALSTASGAVPGL